MKRETWIMELCVELIREISQRDEEQKCEIMLRAKVDGY